MQARLEIRGLVEVRGQRLLARDQALLGATHAQQRRDHLGDVHHRAARAGGRAPARARRRRGWVAKEDDRPIREEPSTSGHPPGGVRAPAGRRGGSCGCRSGARPTGSPCRSGATDVTRCGYARRSPRNTAFGRRECGPRGAGSPAMTRQPILRRALWIELASEPRGQRRCRRARRAWRVGRLRVATGAGAAWRLRQVVSGGLRALALEPQRVATFAGLLDAVARDPDVVLLSDPFDRVAGLATIATLRTAGFDGAIVVLGHAGAALRTRSAGPRSGHAVGRSDQGCDGRGTVAATVPGGRQPALARA